MEMATNFGNNNATTTPRLPPSTDFGPQINLVIWLLTALSSAFLAMRVYCKFLRHRGLWWDDYLLIGSWVALVADCAFISACVNLGFGRPFTQFNFENLDIFLLYSNLAGSFSILAALWSKTSFAVTVLRISSGWTKAFVWFIIGTVNAALGVAIAITWAQCTPIEKGWRPLLEGHCWPKEIQILLQHLYCRAGITSLAKTTQLPTISNATFTESTTLLVLLGAAEPAITVVAASIPIPPGPGPRRPPRAAGQCTVLPFLSFGSLTSFMSGAEVVEWWWGW
ncbi:hypothetical protein CHGG_11071 [Chaetomium globosum CBS 148.51]|uniref:Rhodopsin domain-containing protein n=1 Tax=Chaetomium globosum (strain ATCC 6205 / CBS 148.51 / DSM 1962 / NBRC 6347 / NRRL 1970) TaxID=306901 RepID=Q2GLY5_CHAGB|nr:uncharacterized protein CHGG_11071 [Chaetomium globosum CBS 148.51]EAQ82895.1 hypothetical protein CHGG_11071 [Chaetomium globosum CBS 148.51]